MSRAAASRFTLRDRGLRRVRVVTIWSAIGSAGLTVAGAIALAPSTASKASIAHTTGTSTTGPGVTRKVPGGAADRSRQPTSALTPRPRHSTSGPQLQPPAAPPANAGNGGQHATSGGS